MLAVLRRGQVGASHPIFSRKFIELVAIPASRIDYVGDRLDNNIIPVRDVGLAVIFTEARALGPAHVRRPKTPWRPLTPQGGFPPPKGLSPQPPRHARGPMSERGPNRPTGPQTS